MVFLLAMIALFAPRLVLFFVWALTPLVSRAFGTFIMPLIGFFILPLTTLVYSIAYVPAIGGPTGLGWLWVILALVVDLAAYGGTAYGKQGRTGETQPGERRAA